MERINFNNQYKVRISNPNDIDLQVIFLDDLSDDVNELNKEVKEYVFV